MISTSGSSWVYRSMRAPTAAERQGAYPPAVSRATRRRVLGAMSRSLGRSSGLRRGQVHDVGNVTGGVALPSARGPARPHTGWSALARRARSVTWWPPAFGRDRGRRADRRRPPPLRRLGGAVLRRRVRGPARRTRVLHAEPPRRAEPAGRRPRAQPALGAARPSRTAGSARPWSGMRCASSTSDPEPLVFLEGSPAYYSRFGFVTATDLGFRRPSRRIPLGRRSRWSGSRRTRSG